MPKPFDAHRRIGIRIETRLMMHRAERYDPLMRARQSSAMDRCRDMVDRRLRTAHKARQTGDIIHVPFLVGCRAFHHVAFPR